MYVILLCQCVPAEYRTFSISPRINDKAHCAAKKKYSGDGEAEGGEARGFGDRRVAEVGHLPPGPGGPRRALAVTVPTRFGDSLAILAAQI